MKQNYFRFIGKELKVLHIESIRLMFYQVAGGLIISTFGTELILIIINLIHHYNPFKNFLFLPLSYSFGGFFFLLFMWILGILIPAAALILARRFPPAPAVTFHSDTQSVRWQCQALRFAVPFSAIITPAIKHCEMMLAHCAIKYNIVRHFNESLWNQSQYLIAPLIKSRRYFHRYLRNTARCTARPA